MRDHRAPLPIGFVLLLAGLALLTSLAQSGLADLLQSWLSEAAYGHGFIVAFIALYLFLTRLPKLTDTPPSGRNWGVLAFVLLLVLLVMSEAAHILTFSQYIYVLLLAALAVSGWGLQILPIVAPSLLIVLFVVPLPDFAQAMLTADLQLLSSKIGVQLLMWAQVPVYLEGNVIDLGLYKLQVVEACAGLNYLYPLLGIAFLLAYSLSAPFWQRLVLVLAAIPITVLLNSLRIAIAGVLVNRRGPQAADGFMHFFEGWLVFVLCLVMLVGVMGLLSRVFSRRRLADSFDLALTVPRDGLRQLLAVQSRGRLLICTAAAVAGLLVSSVLADRPERIPKRPAFELFPMQLGAWSGVRGRLNEATLGILSLSDYLLVRFQNTAEAEPVELYLAYYDTQLESGGVHSPKACLPGGGWEISQLKTLLKQTPVGPVRLNRAVINKGLERRVVYYWFQQGGNTFANEYLVKADILRRSFVDKSSNGALVRISSTVAAEESPAEAEARLNRFLALSITEFEPHIPD